jgi:protein involved in polysaccharide export with SLBB domain
MSKNIKQSSSNSLLIDGNSDFFLEPFDRVSVRYLKGYTAQKNVSIEGEVSYPGNYAIIDKDERISDLVNKAGGFSPYAYLKGATIIRKVANSTEEEQLRQLEGIIRNDSLGNKEDLAKTEFKIGIDLEKIMALEGQKSKFDLILKEGDRLVVPSEKQTVEVRGQVLSPSLSRFDKSNSFKDYIDNSGGFSENAKKKKAYVIYANGDINTTKNFIFFKSYPEIEPGALIVVPEKAERKNKLSITEILGITTAITTMGLLLKAFL